MRLLDSVTCPWIPVSVNVRVGSGGVSGFQKPNVSRKLFVVVGISLSNPMLLHKSAYFGDVPGGGFSTSNAAAGNLFRGISPSKHLIFHSDNALSEPGLPLTCRQGKRHADAMRAEHLGLELPACAVIV